MVTWDEVHRLNLPWEAACDLRHILDRRSTASITQVVAWALQCLRETYYNDGDDRRGDDDDDHRGPDPDRPGPPPPPGDAVRS